MIILMVRMIILMGQDDGFPTPHPTTPHPKLRFRKFNGRFQLIIWPWPDGGGARPWPSGAGGAGSGPPRSGSGPGPGPRHFRRPQRPLAMPGAAAARPWERPVNFRKRHLGWGGVGWGGVGWGGVGLESHHPDPLG